jgi:hypothetical protein
MRIYVFKSETTDRLRAFAGDPDVNKLPSQHGPWTATGIIAPDNAPPYNLSRDAIEKAINAEGFQLWRLRDKKWTQNWRSVSRKNPSRLTHFPLMVEANGAHDGKWTTSGWFAGSHPPSAGAVDKALALGVLASELAGATDRFSFSRFALSDGFS